MRALRSPLFADRDMLILRTLLYGAAYGHHIGKHIQRTTNDFLQTQHGSLYSAPHRLEKRGWIISKWETAPGRNRDVLRPQRAQVA